MHYLTNDWLGILIKIPRQKTNNSALWGGGLINIIRTIFLLENIFKKIISSYFRSTGCIFFIALWIFWSWRYSMYQFLIFLIFSQSMLQCLAINIAFMVSTLNLDFSFVYIMEKVLSTEAVFPGRQSLHLSFMSWKFKHFLHISVNICTHLSDTGTFSAFNCFK